MISNIIPTYNRRDTLLAHLHLIKAQTYRDFEVIVVDDGSDDGTEEAVNSFCPNYILKYKKLQHNGFGAGRARNVGASMAQGDILLFTDDDILCPSDHFEWVANSVKSGKCLVFKTSRLDVYGPVLTYPVGACAGLCASDFIPYNEIPLYGLEDAEMGTDLDDIGVVVYLEEKMQVLHFYEEEPLEIMLEKLRQQKEREKDMPVRWLP